jgi:hypothetical protein
MDFGSWLHNGQIKLRPGGRKSLSVSRLAACSWTSFCRFIFNNTLIAAAINSFLVVDNNAELQNTRPVNKCSNNKVHARGDILSVNGCMCELEGLNVELFQRF